MALDDNKFSPFPDPLAPKEEKATTAYGMKYAKAIWGNYLNNITSFSEQRDIDIICRTYAEGLESIDKFKTRKGITNTSYLNLDYSPVNIIATTVDNIVGRLSNTPYKIQCNPIDPESKSRFDNYRKELFADMFLKQYSDAVQEQTGIPLVKRNAEIPETDEEAELHLKMNYKDDASIAMEEAFNFVFSSNDFDASREAIIEDLITIKRAAIQNKYDECGNIIVERVDPIDLITPYSKYQDFRNIPYIALIKSYTVGQLAEMNPSFTDKDLYTIAQNNAGSTNNNPVWTYGSSYEGYYGNNTGGITMDRPYYNFNVKVLEFYFLAIDKEAREFKTYAKRKYSNKVAADFKSKDGEVAVKKIQNLYEGRWIINSDYCFNYGRAKNIPREKISGSYYPKAKLPIRVIAPGLYDMKNKSHVERMIPHEDAIKLADLAFQTMLIKAKPPGVAMDIRGLMDAAKSLGENFGPMDVAKIYEQTGNYVYSSSDENGEIINSRVITELRGGVSDAMQSLIAVYQFQRQLINEVIGYNAAVDASSPDKNTLVGVQKNAIQATNNSLRPLFNAAVWLIQETAKDVALRIQDSLEYNNEAFQTAIGIHATKALDYGKNLAMVQMGIKVELLPDDEEKMYIENQLALGQQSGTLNASDVIRVRAVLKEDAKLAAKLLVFLEDKNRKNKMKEQQALSQQNAEVQTQAAQSAAEAQMGVQSQMLDIEKQKLAMEWDLKTQYMLAESQEIQKQIMLKNNGMIQVQEVKNDGADNVERVAHDAKILQKEHEVAIMPKEETGLL
jgi:hypothetical protein